MVKVGLVECTAFVPVALTRILHVADVGIDGTVQTYCPLDAGIAGAMVDHVAPLSTESSMKMESTRVSLQRMVCDVPVLHTTCAAGDFTSSDCTSNPTMR